MLKFYGIKSVCVYRDSDLAIVRSVVNGRETCKVVKLMFQDDNELLKALHSPEITKVYDRTPSEVVNLWQRISRKFHLVGE